MKKQGGSLEKKNKQPFIEIDPGAMELLKGSAKAALFILGSAAAITVAVALPGLADALSREYKKHERAEMRRIYIRERFDPLGKDAKQFKKSQQTLFYLRRQRYVTYNSKVKNSIITITTKGKAYLRKIRLVAAAPRKPEAWDKTWWVVLADIPTKTHRAAAEHLRLKLKVMGFYPLQRTVWVHPYNPTRAINELTQYYDLGKFVTVLQAQKLDYDDLSTLQKHFSI